MTYFTTDRIVSTACFTLLSAALFLSPAGWVEQAALALTWAVMAFLTFVFGIGVNILISGDEQTVAYSATVAHKRIEKNTGIVGDLLDQIPAAGIAAVLIWNQFLIAGTTAVILWAVSNFIIQRCITIFQSLEDEDQRNLIKEIEERKSS